MLKYLVDIADIVDLVDIGDVSNILFRLTATAHLVQQVIVTRQAFLETDINQSIAIQSVHTRLDYDGNRSTKTKLVNRRTRWEVNKERIHESKNIPQPDRRQVGWTRGRLGPTEERLPWVSWVEGRPIPGCDEDGDDDDGDDDGRDNDGDGHGDDDDSDDFGQGDNEDYVNDDNMRRRPLWKKSQGLGPIQCLELPCGKEVSLSQIQNPKIIFQGWYQPNTKSKGWKSLTWRQLRRQKEFWGRPSQSRSSLRSFQKDCSH